MAVVMSEFAGEFRDILDTYIKLTADLARIADVGRSEEDSQALVQAILDNSGCLTEIQTLNKRLIYLYGVWKDREADSGLPIGDEIRGVVGDVRAQMRQIENLCTVKASKVEARRKQLTRELANVGKGSRYLKMINPIKENHPKFIDSAC